MNPPQGYGKRRRRRDWWMTPIVEFSILVCGIVIGAACRDIIHNLHWWP